MGGRSSSSAGRGSGGGVTKVGRIDLREFPLKYGSEDHHFSNAIRKQIEKFEDSNYKKKNEHNVLVDSNGNVVETNVGGKGSVGYSESAARKSTTTSHNHPRDDDKLLGGTFSGGDPDDPKSGGDIKGFIRYDNQITKRATAQEGTYSISKLDGFDGDSLLRAYNKASSQANAEYKKELQGYYIKYNTPGNSNYSYKAYQADRAKAFNRWMVKNHNWLLDNQTKYGYYYTLERRK